MSGLAPAGEATSPIVSSSPVAVGGASAARRRGDRLVGSSRAVQRVLEQVAVAGRGRFHVFISGEEGSEKELIARLVHEASDWKTGGFFAVDASLVPETLLARELLGSERGALPSLPSESVGAFARTAGGTVLIDRIETLPKDLQHGLALGLGDARYHRVGGGAALPLECRVIGSSSESLEALVQSGELDPELGERLRLLEIRIPALRDRRDDILPLAARALVLASDEIERELGRSPKARGFTREALERLRAYNWPGNERELLERVRAALRLTRGEEIDAEDLALGSAASDELPSFRDAKRAFERDYVARVLRLCAGNISRAARIAKKDRKDFYDVLRRNQINPDDYR
ncbi:MAG: sigma 54-interacting transcriptional regulator [Myxococcota bacterium]